MKIKIHREKYYNNPCPKITKEMWDWFYATLWLSFCSANHKNVKKVYTMDIRINQAYKGCINIHFYVTINKGLESEFEFHQVYCGFANYFQQPRYRWMVDFIHIGGIDLGTDKPMEKHNREMKIFNLKRKTKQNVKVLVSEYRTYLKLRDKFNYLNI